jgi:integrase/recombinase XerD
MLDQSLVTIRPGEIVNQADTDGQVLALWLHGRSKHTQRAYSAKAARFLAFVMKPLVRVSLDLQAFADSLTGLAQSSKAQTLAAIKSLLAFAHKIGYIPFNVGAAPAVAESKEHSCRADSSRVRSS